MNSATEEKMKRIDELAKEDEVYRYMLDECATLEEEFDMIVSKLSLKRRGQIWDFVMHCEDCRSPAATWRLLTKRSNEAKNRIKTTQCYLGDPVINECDCALLGCG